MLSERPAVCRCGIMTTKTWVCSGTVSAMQTTSVLQSVQSYACDYRMMCREEWIVVSIASY